MAEPCAHEITAVVVACTTHAQDQPVNIPAQWQEGPMVLTLDGELLTAAVLWGKEKPIFLKDMDLVSR